MTGRSALVTDSPSASASSGAATATSAEEDSRPSPIMPSRSGGRPPERGQRRRRRDRPTLPRGLPRRCGCGRAVAVMTARTRGSIERVEQVRDQVHHDDRRREHQEDPSQQRDSPGRAGLAVSSPRPGQLNTVSTVIAPDTTKPRLRKNSVIDGSSALAARAGAAPDRRAGPWPGRSCRYSAYRSSKMDDAHDQRILGDVDDGQRDHRQHQVLGDVQPVRQRRARDRA